MPDTTVQNREHHLSNDGDNPVATVTCNIRLNWAVVNLVAAVDRVTCHAILYDKLCG